MGFRGVLGHEFMGEALEGNLDAVYDLEDAERGFTRASERGVRKILLRGT